MKVILLPFLVMGIVNARPQDTLENKFDTLQEGVETLTKDLSNVVESKTGALTFIGGTTFNWTVDAAGAASEGIGQASNYVGSISLQGIEGGLNDTESAILVQKVAMIQKLFNAKRRVLQTLGLWKAQVNAGLNAFANNLSNLYTSSLGSISVAVNTTTTIVTETIPTTFTWNNTINSIGGAYNATAASITATGSDLITALLGVKQQMHETLENFDSQEALVQQTNNIALKLNATMNGISDISEAWGVFDAFDNIMGGIHGISVGVGKVPLKIKTYLTGTEDEETEVATTEPPLDIDEDETERMEGKQDTFDVEYKRITNALEYVPITDTLEDIPITEGIAEEDFRMRRNAEPLPDLSMEEIDEILKTELKFWNALNDVLTRENRMFKYDVPK